MTGDTIRGKGHREKRVELQDDARYTKAAVIPTVDIDGKILINLLLPRSPDPSKTPDPL